MMDIHQLTKDLEDYRDRIMQVSGCPPAGIRISHETAIACELDPNTWHRIAGWSVFVDPQEEM